MATRSKELEQEIERLTREREEAILAEHAQVERQLQLEKQAEEQRRKAEEEATKRWLAEQEVKHQHEHEEFEQENRAQLEQMLSLLPTPESMPRCRDCGHLYFFPQDNVPPVISEAGRTALECGGCGKRVISSFYTEAFPIRFE